MTKYCEECGKEVKTIIVEKCEEYEIIGELIEVNAKILTCSECGEEFYNEELDTATLVEAYNIYRRKHKLLMPAEIKQIREYSRAVKPPIRQAGNRLSGLTETAYASLLA